MHVYPALGQRGEVPPTKRPRDVGQSQFTAVNEVTVTAPIYTSSMSSELVSVSLPAELLNEARDVACGGAVGSVSDYVAEAVRLRLAKDRALAQITRLFGGPPPEEVLAVVRQRAGLSPRSAAS